MASLVAEERREEKVPTQFAQRRYEQGFLPKELQNFAQRRYEQGFQRKELQNFAPFVRWLQRANKVEYVNMFVILSGTGRGIRKQ